MISLVDQQISQAKLLREIERWEQSGLPRKRGWLMLGYDATTLIVDIAFLARVSTSAGSSPMPVIACAIRLNYDNYDIWPPSLTFIDGYSRQPAVPHVRAFQPAGDGTARDVLINGHPTTSLPFLCLPGIREYHTHPQHTGDDWLLHRDLGEGSLLTISERVWHYMVRNVVGLNINLQALPVWPLRAQVNISLAQGDVDQVVGKSQVPAKEGVQVVVADPAPGPTDAPDSSKADA